MVKEVIGRISKMGGNRHFENATEMNHSGLALMIFTKTIDE